MLGLQVVITHKFHRATFSLAYCLESAMPRWIISLFLVPCFACGGGCSLVIPMACIFGVTFQFVLHLGSAEPSSNEFCSFSPSIQTFYLPYISACITCPPCCLNNLRILMGLSN